MSEYFQYKEYIGSISYDLEEQVLYGQIEFINDLVTYEGETIKELHENFLNAITDYIETCETVGKEPNRPYSGTFNIRIGPELHRRLAVKAKLENVSINEEVKSSIEARLTDQETVLHKHIYITGSFPMFKPDRYIYEDKYQYINKEEDDLIQWKNQRRCDLSTL